MCILLCSKTKRHGKPNIINKDIRNSYRSERRQDMVYTDVYGAVINIHQF